MPALTVSGDLGTALAPWLRRASKKHPFAFTVNVQAREIPFTPGRIAAIMTPQATVYIGGDATVVASGPQAGLPLNSGQYLSFGEEEGDSPTWVIAGSVFLLYCLELLP